VSAPASPPVADFSASPLGGNAPLPVQFTDQSTGAASWSWDFGDGGSSTLQNPSHLYSGGGVFTVTLTVGNSAGQNTKTRIAYITVTALPSAPVAEFFGGPLTGTAPLTVQFTDQSSGSPNAWSWDFGDGELSSQRNPSHTYDAPGTYTVRLTALNAGGQTTRTRTGYITVSPVSAADFLCTAVIVELGKLLGGDHINLQASDDSYLKAKAAKSDGLFSDQLSYTFRTGFGSLSTLSVRVESRPKKAPVRQQVFVFNPGTGNWELVDDRSLPTRSETSMTIGVSNPARFLSASGEVRVRIRTGDIAGGKWKHFIDQVKITAAP
jgi:PKD repeat protein